MTRRPTNSKQQPKFILGQPRALSARLAQGAAVLVVLSIGLTWLPIADASPHPQVRLATQDPDRPLQVRPRMVSYTGDGTGYLAGRVSAPRNTDHGGLHWRHWGRLSGFATGYAWINNCRPSCANGRFTKHRTRVRVRRPRHRIFTRMTIRFVYGGRHIVDHRALYHQPGSYYEGTYYPGYYSWGICGDRYTKPC
jgi:hypothetical protein